MSFGLYLNRGVEYSIPRLTPELHQNVGYATTEPTNPFCLFLPDSASFRLHSPAPSTVETKADHAAKVIDFQVPDLVAKISSEPTRVVAGASLTEAPWRDLLVCFGNLAVLPKACCVNLFADFMRRETEIFRLRIVEVFLRS
jgi:hypothetical protein